MLYFVIRIFAAIIIYYVGYNDGTANGLDKCEMRSCAKGIERGLYECEATHSLNKE